MCIRDRCISRLYRSRLPGVKRTADALAAPVPHVGVDHRGAHVLVVQGVPGTGYDARWSSRCVAKGTADARHPACSALHQFISWTRCETSIAFEKKTKLRFLEVTSRPERPQSGRGTILRRPALATHSPECRS